MLLFPLKFYFKSNFYKKKLVFSQNFCLQRKIKKILIENNNTLYLHKNNVFLSAWEEKKDKKTTFNSGYDIFLDYTEYSTIQGLIYIFFAYQTNFGKIFWSAAVLLLFSLGIYWCTQAYHDWRTNPVLTTITTTALSINEVFLY